MGQHDKEICQVQVQRDKDERILYYPSACIKAGLEKHKDYKEYSESDHDHICTVGVSSHVRNVLISQVIPGLSNSALLLSLLLKNTAVPRLIPVLH